MRAAISRCLGVSLGASSPNHFTASLMPNSVVWLMLRPAILTASASGLRRAAPPVPHLPSRCKRPRPPRPPAEPASFQPRPLGGGAPPKDLLLAFHAQRAV